MRQAHLGAGLMSPLPMAHCTHPSSVPKPASTKRRIRPQQTRRLAGSGSVGALEATEEGPEWVEGGDGRESVELIFVAMKEVWSQQSTVVEFER